MAGDCKCPTPQHTGMGKCGRCGKFACEYAGRGRTRSSSAICDCFIEQYPDDPFGLHPEAFTVNIPKD
jgi:hypothetical protein